MELSRFKKITYLSLPIIGGMLSQNLLNLIDTAMVGTLGNAALAAVGLGGFVNFLAASLILGLSSGVQTLSARRKGEGRMHQAGYPLNAGLLLALFVGIPLSTIFFLIAPYAYPFLNSDADVIRQGVPYLQARLVVMTAVGMNFSFRGFWNGINRSQYYMGTLVFMHTLNVLFNYMFIFGKWGAPELGAEGAGVASAIATALGTVCYFVLGLKHARKRGFLAGIPNLSVFQALVKLSVPSSIQQFFFAGGWVALYWIIGQVGTVEVAAANVIINIALVAILPGLGLGMVALSLVSQALGREDPHEAKQWGWDVVKVGVMVLTALGIIAVVVPDLLLSVFIHDPVTMKVARTPLQLWCGFMGVEAAGLILMHALLGAGASKFVMQVSVGMQWGFFLPVAWIIGPGLGFGLLEIYIAQVVYRILQSLIFGMAWYRGTWASIKV